MTTFDITTKLAAWSIIAVIFYIGYKAFKSVFGSNKGEVMFCTACGHEGPATMKTSGSIGIEIVLWLCLIVPGLIYSIWRLTSKKATCSACGGEHLIPPGSPVAIATKARLAQQ